MSAAVDTSLLDARIAAALDRHGGVPHDPDMQARVEQLESHIGEIKDVLKRFEPAIGMIVSDLSGMKSEITSMKSDISGVKTDLFDMKLELAEVKGKVSQLPTLFQIGSTMLTLHAGIVGVAALAVAFLRMLT